MRGVGVDAKTLLEYIDVVMKITRPYTMSARADAVRETRERILEATMSVAAVKPLAALTLGDVASLAEVTVQTVLRQFDSRERLLYAVAEHAASQVNQERVTRVGDVEAAVRTVVAHYERRGDAVLVLLAQDQWDARVQAVTDNGRAFHRRWVTEVFAPQLNAHPEREAVLDLLVVSTDIYTWKLLRRDRRLSQARTHARMLRLVRAVLEGA